MEFSFIENLGVRTELNVLKCDSQPYSMLMYQHEGTLTGDTQSIHNETDVKPRFSAFLEMAKKNNSDLVLTAEYSCPWLIIYQILQDPAIWPSDGKLWALGCESISKPEIQIFQETFNDETIRVHFDQRVLHKDKEFLDPLIYIFKGSDRGKEKLIILIQFKTYHMGVWSETLESNHLIEGNEIYILKNSNNFVRFFSLICSDAMYFEDNMKEEKMVQLDWVDKTYLIFNPQCNPDPLHRRFSNFRSYLLQFEKKVLINLNWTSTSFIKRNALTKYNISWSGLVIKSVQVNIKKHVIKNNHRLGMYYFSMIQNKYAFILNSSVHVFNLLNNPVDITAGITKQQRKDGPQMLEIFKFNPQGNELIKIFDCPGEFK